MLGSQIDDAPVSKEKRAANFWPVFLIFRTWCLRSRRSENWILMMSLKALI